MFNRTKKIGKLIILACLVTIIAVIFAGCNGKTNPYVENLDIVMTLNQDGSADIVQTQEVKFNIRDKDWWNYYLSINLSDDQSGNYGNTLSQLQNLTISVDGVNYPIQTNLTISDLENFSTFEKIQYQGKGYAAYSGVSNIELGVIMPQFSYGNKVITFSYTLTNFMISYADCDGIYYKFLEESETNYVKNFTAEVNFEKAASVDDVAVWTHIDTGSAANYLDKENLNKVVYEGSDIDAGTYLETRLILKNSSYDSLKKNDTTFSGIVEEESKWMADFEKEVRKAKIVNVLDYIFAALAIVLSIFLVVIMKKKLKAKPLDNSPIYYREIPSGWTAGEMAPLYHYYSPKFDISDSMSATILDLCRRGYINIEVGEKKKEAVISIKNTSNNNLRGHEVIMFGILKKTASAYGGTFTMKEMEKYASKNYDDFAKSIEEYKKASKAMTTAMNCYPPKHGSKFLSIIKGVGTIFFVIAGIMLFNTIIAGIGNIYFKAAIVGFLLGGGILAIASAKQKIPLTQTGQKHYDVFFALGKFMQEFSNMKDHELPQLVLWEEFMVYATAMGIADKVSEQLEIAYPEYKAMLQSDYYGTGYNNTFLILYLMSPRVRIGSNFAMTSVIKGINANVMNLSRQAKITAAAKKYGGGFGGGFGGGGGFSGGGGGFGGGGRGAR